MYNNEFNVTCYISLAPCKIMSELKPNTTWLELDLDQQCCPFDSVSDKLR